MDWSGCRLVVCRPGYLSSAPALRDDPRVPASTIIDNMDASEAEDDRAAALQVIEWFQLTISVEDVLEIYHYAQRQRRDDQDGHAS